MVSLEKLLKIVHRIRLCAINRLTGKLRGKCPFLEKKPQKVKVMFCAKYVSRGIFFITSGGNADIACHVKLKKKQTYSLNANSASTSMIVSVNERRVPVV